MSKRADIDFFSGDHVDFTVIVIDGNNAPALKNLTGALAIVWVISKSQGSTPLLTKNLSSGITITDAVGGKFLIALVPADSEGLGGKYYHEAKVKDSTGKISTVIFGSCRIDQNSIQLT